MHLFQIQNLRAPLIKSTKTSSILTFPFIFPEERKEHKSLRSISNGHNNESCMLYLTHYRLKDAL